MNSIVIYEADNQPVQLCLEGKRKRMHYNLDAIISVGYRVHWRRATEFRQWATSVLRQHIVDGYTPNQQRLNERGIEFEQGLNLLSHTLAKQQLVSAEGAAVLQQAEVPSAMWQPGYR